MALSRVSVIILSSVVVIFTVIACLRSSVIISSTEASLGQSKTIATTQQKTSQDDDNHNDEDKNLFCAVLNPLSGAYIDLSQLSATPNKPQDDNGRHGDSDKDASKWRWLVKDTESKMNFTLSICSSPVTAKEEDQLSDLTGAFYNDPDEDHKLISIGNFNTKPTILTNKKLSLKYEDGSMCPNKIDKKATLIYFVCDKDITTKAQITYIGSLHQCSYFFEVRSIYACPTSNKSKEVNVLGIFVGIFAVFFIVEYGGRRWLYNKMKTHFHSSMSSEPTNYNSAFSTNERYFRPRWEYIEREPKWKSFMKSIGNLATRLVLRPTRFTRPTSAATGSIRLNSQGDLSQESFLNDIEQQNNILDSLEVTNSDTNSTRDTATRRNE